MDGDGVVIAGRQKLTYDLGDYVLATWLGVNYDPLLAQGAAVEVERVEFLVDEPDVDRTTVTLTISEALTLIEHLSAAVKGALTGDENFCEVEEV